MIKGERPIPTLAGELKRLRGLKGLKGWTLRQVEEKTEGRVSNSYLYQLESGAVKEPSPHILHELAKVYGVSYAKLMSLAGYVVPKNSSQTPAGASIAFSALNMSNEEEQEVLDFIQFRRQQRGKRGV